MSQLARTRTSAGAPALWLLALPLVLACASGQFTILAAERDLGPRSFTAGADELPLTVTASFSAQQFVKPREQIELLLNRELKEAEGKAAVLIGLTDVTSLFTQEKLRLRYNSRLWPLPAGESVVTVFLISQDHEWQEIAHFTLRVANEKDAGRGDKAEPIREETNSSANFVKDRTRGSGPSAESPDGDFTTETQQASEPASQSSARKNRKIKFLPSLTLTVPSQPAQSTFPGPQPERATFTELTMQASLKSEATYGILNMQSSFDLAGSSFEKEALRFGTLGSSAPQVDLSSYLIQFQTGKLKYQVGHFSYGTQRELINGFSSRGIMISVPFLQRFDFSAAAMNGTQLVGYDNFFGLDKRTNEMLSGTLGMEVFAKHPGELRLEVGVLSAYFQPASGVNRGVVTDVQRSRGISLRLIANDKKQRFHFDGGFTRSFFVSPTDTTLSQGASLVPLPALSRNAHYLEASYNVLQNFSLTKTKKANLIVAFREENVAPLFRSLGASTQADKVQYELSVSGSVNEISAQFSQANFHDNLRDIPSILKSLTGSTHFSLAAPASALLNQTKSSAWLPRLGFSFDRVHAFGAVVPVNGGFELDPSSVPDLVGTNETFSADWQIKKFTVGYGLNHSFQNNQQPGREQADQGVLVNTGRLGIAASSKLNFNLDLSRESAANKETGRVDRTYRVGPGISWQLTRQMGFTTSLANTIAGDAAKTSHNRNTEFDCSWTYRFQRGQEGLKKVAGQFFIRYANHYSHAFDRVFITNTLNRNQTLTANLGITFF